MKIPISKIMLVGFVISLLSFELGLQNEALAGGTIKLYYEENAQVELISPAGSRVLIDVNNPDALSSPPTANDVLLTTHNHGDHRRLDFVKSFPGKQLEIKTGAIPRMITSLSFIAPVLISSCLPGKDFTKSSRR